MRFQIGDKVIIQQKLDKNTTYAMDDATTPEAINNIMRRYCGQPATITNMVDLGDGLEYLLDIDGQRFFWVDGMFDIAASDKFISKDVDIQHFLTLIDESY